MRPKVLSEAIDELLEMLKGMKKPATHCCFPVIIEQMEEDLFYAVSAIRVFFKSRDRDWVMMGLGAADLLKGPKAFLKFCQKRPTLFLDQFYFFAERFDEEAPIAKEWQNFGKTVLILPLVSMVKKNGITKLVLSYRAEVMPFDVWLDHTTSILQALKNPKKNLSSVRHEPGEHLPGKEQYLSNLKQALADLDEHHKQKVVMGRRNSLRLQEPLDPAELFFRLKIENAFLFFIDLGFNSAFFGASPELLYRRIGREFATESLAGTRARSQDKVLDEALKSELSLSAKDIGEHALVSLYIEEKLKLLSTKITSSPLEVRALSYVQHLLKRYFAHLSPNIGDEHIIKMLHPTPAVCGQDPWWAKCYIREVEEFDRGLYAGPIGILGQDEAEVSVGIRSALYFQQNLYIYVASGIVKDSVPQDEWEELSFKEKTMMSIFHDG